MGHIPKFRSELSHLSPASNLTWFLAYPRKQNLSNVRQVSIAAIKGVIPAIGTETNVDSYLRDTCHEVWEKINAAIVINAINLTDIRDVLDKANHIAAIHKAPEQYWQQLTELLIEKEWSVKQTETLLTPSKPAIGTETSQNFVDIHEVCPSLFPRLVSG